MRETNNDKADIYQIFVAKMLGGDQEERNGKFNVAILKALALYCVLEAFSCVEL